MRGRRREINAVDLLQLPPGDLTTNDSHRRPYVCESVYWYHSCIRQAVLHIMIIFNTSEEVQAVIFSNLLYLLYKDILQYVHTTAGSGQTKHALCVL